MAPRPYSDEEIIRAIQGWAKEHGRRPTHNEWRQQRMRPSTPAINRAFGSWSNALVAAGFEAQINFGDRDKWDETRDVIMPRWRAGESFASIGRSLDVSGQNIGRRVHRYLALESHFGEYVKKAEKEG